MDRDNPIDPDATDSRAAGESDRDASAGVSAATVAEGHGERDDPVTERIETTDRDDREIAPRLEATDALDEDRPTECIADGAALASRDRSGTMGCQLTDVVVTRIKVAPPVVGLEQTAAIGRYRTERQLGRGSFGEVFLAHDSELNRRVAIKIPYSARIANSGEFEDYVYEARILAGLDHGGIVPIYDIGRMADGRCYIVSKYVDGCSLDRRLRDERPAPAIVAGWVATAAEALAFAHALSVVHRDVKPANILLDRAGRLYVADFGLARREQDLEAERGFYGTPAYASPEQARGEGHRVDGRSDIFSLGVVLYEALTGTNPFRGRSLRETLERILEHAPPPVRAVDATIPAELDRICQKAMAKRIDDRYESAAALAADLRYWLAEAGTAAGAAARDGSPGRSLVSRGLRPYEDTDADAFLDLVPGPRGRDGLPESIGFWKRCIEAGGDADADAFPVGVIYGPTGSGKSSLVRAGLIPRLDESVCRVYVESTIAGTEQRLLRALHGTFPSLAAHHDVAGLLRELRQGKDAAGPRKVLIVLDQFEQWLFGQRAGGRRALEDALRQCDGERIQALLLVRDDFWMDLTRFFRGLEVRLMDGWNAAAVDLFDLEHARKVLTLLGRVHGRLPADPAALAADHREFVERAVSALAQDGRVVCVRLVLLAQLLRSRPWTPATLAELGGAATIGATILDEAFSSPQAPPQNRLHRRAARAVLGRLLPEGGALIKGHVSPRQALLEASGYASQPREFQELMWILDHELRLVTPADPLFASEEGDAPAPPEESRFYQLAHDYLIPDLRAWLFRDQQKSLRGRAELRLQEFATLWSERHKGKFLPSALEWAGLRLLTDKRRWSAEARAMMRAAAARHARSAVFVGVAALILGLAGAWGFGALKARSLVARLETAEIGQVLQIARDLEPFRAWAAPILRRQAAEGSADPGSRLRCSLALVRHDPGQVDYLVGRMVAEDLRTALTIREALLDRREAITPGLWGIAGDARRPGRERLLAALALCLYDPPDGPEGRRRPPAWDAIAGPVADALVTLLDADPAAYAPVVEAVEPMRDVLIGKLREHFVRRGDRRIQTATNLLIELARDNPRVLGELALDADDHQFRKVFPLLQRHRSSVVPALRAAAAPPAGRAPVGDERATVRRAVAAISLLRLGGSADAWEIFRNEPDPRARTFVIHHGARYGLPLASLIARLAMDDDPARVRGLILAIGNHDALDSSAPERGRVASIVRARFLGHDDAGVHGAAEWLLAKLGAGGSAGAADLVAGSTRGRAPRHWFRTSEGHTMVIIDARKDPRIGRAFAIAARETTVEQMLRFDPGHWYNRESAPEPTCPINVVTWPRAIEYCEWLDRREGLDESQSCYARASGQPAGPEVRLDLTRTGYRPPTRAEWEFACRAGTVTRRYYGNDDNDELLRYYVRLFARGSRVRLDPVGRRMPNDFGLFDMYGNVTEWNAEPPDKDNHVFTSGGGYKALPRELDSEYYLATSPGLEYNQYGFRIARTIELDGEGAAR